MRKILIPAISIITSFTVGYLCHSHSSHRHRPAAVTADTVVTTRYVRDTIIVSIPQPAGITPVLDRYIPFVIEKKDTVFLPVERRIYCDSTFYAEVSGYHPSLDTLAIFPAAREETRSITVRTPSSTATRRTRFGLGITAGATVTPRGLAPGLTLGLTYRLL